MRNEQGDAFEGGTMVCSEWMDGWMAGGVTSGDLTVGGSRSRDVPAGEVVEEGG